MTYKKLFAIKAYLVIGSETNSKVFLGYVHQKTHYCLYNRREDSFSHDKIRFYKRRSDLQQSLNTFKRYNFNGRNFRVENSVYCFSRNQIIFDVEEFDIVPSKINKTPGELVDFLFDKVLDVFNKSNYNFQDLEFVVKELKEKQQKFNT